MKINMLIILVFFCKKHASRIMHKKSNFLKTESYTMFGFGFRVIMGMYSLRGNFNLALKFSDSQLIGNNKSQVLCNRRKLYNHLLFQNDFLPEVKSLQFHFPH